MPSKRRKSVGVVELPKGVHRVVSRGREYFYWHPGRGTKHAGERQPLPNDPTKPEFWVTLREFQGSATGTATVTFGDVIDLYVVSPQFTKLAVGTQDQYQRQLKVARAGFGTMPADAIRSSMMRGVVDGLADSTGAANNFLGVMRALSKWGVVRDYFPASITEGIEPYAVEGGHKPWTPKQLKAAEERLTGMVRRAFFLYRYTGQRGSDIVRLSESFIDEGGFRLTQQKTKREIWCPIDDALAAEMATWERAPGPFLKQTDGRPYTRKRFNVHFDKQREEIPELHGVSLHGLRATRVVELRRFGLTPPQIQDQVGMSMGMIERYCRFADKKASGKASVVSLAERRKNGAL